MHIFIKFITEKIHPPCKSYFRNNNDPNIIQRFETKEKKKENPSHYILAQQHKSILEIKLLNSPQIQDSISRYSICTNLETTWEAKLREANCEANLSRWKNSFSYLSNLRTTKSEKKRLCMILTRKKTTRVVKASDSGNKQDKIRQKEKVFFFYFFNFSWKTVGKFSFSTKNLSPD